MKVCNICGIEVDNRTDECPNCGSVSFRTEDKSNMGKFFREKMRFRY